MFSWTWSGTCKSTERRNNPFWDTSSCLEFDCNSEWIWPWIHNIVSHSFVCHKFRLDRGAVDSRSQIVRSIYYLDVAAYVLESLIAFAVPLPKLILFRRKWYGIVDTIQMYSQSARQWRNHPTIRKLVISSVDKSCTFGLRVLMCIRDCRWLDHQIRHLSTSHTNQTDRLQGSQ